MDLTNILIALATSIIVATILTLLVEFFDKRK